MSTFRDFLSKATTDNSYEHPLLDFLQGKSPAEVTLRIHRPRSIIGFQSPKFYVSLGDELPREYAWDGELDDVLIDRGFRAADVQSEQVRFSMAIQRSMKPIGIRFGDGLYNSVLLIAIEAIELHQVPPVDAIFQELRRSRPWTVTRGYEDCQKAIETALRFRAGQLLSKLHYNENETQQVFAGAVASYLDERFSVSDSKRWLGGTA